jgi:hypothetical protein
MLTWSGSVFGLFRKINKRTNSKGDAHWNLLRISIQRTHTITLQSDFEELCQTQEHKEALRQKIGAGPKAVFVCTLYNLQLNPAIFHTHWLQGEKNISFSCRKINVFLYKWEEDFFYICPKNLQIFRCETKTIWNFFLFSMFYW